MREDLEEILMQDDVTISIENNIERLLKIIPEIKSMIGFEHKHPDHHLDVFKHTLLALSLAPNDFEIRLVLLLHDIGKPFSYQEGEIRSFKGHPKVSSIMVESILKRLGYEEYFIEEVCTLIRLHDFPLKQSEIENDINLSYKRYQIQYCDALAHHPDKLEKRKEYLNKVKKMIMENK